MTEIQDGERIRGIDILEILPPDEGEINQYYGRIGTGKTSAGTRRILSELRRGVIVYANWQVKWDGYDERQDIWKLFLGSIGLKKIFYNYPKENFHFWRIDDTFIDKLASLTSCSIHLDEGHIPFDSYEATRMSIAKRTAVLSTRHYDRSINIYSQRPTAIHVTVRANVNRFYKCEKPVDFSLFGTRFIKFKITEFQDLIHGDTVDETRVKSTEPPFEDTEEYEKMVSEEQYWGRKKIFESYNTKYLRGDMKESQTNLAELYRLTIGESWSNLKQMFKKNKKKMSHSEAV